MRACAAAVFVLLGVGMAWGQDSSVAGFLVATRVARRDMVADSGRLWGVRLDTIPWLGVWQGRLIQVGAAPRLAGIRTVKRWQRRPRGTGWIRFGRRK